MSQENTSGATPPERRLSRRELRELERQQLSESLQFSGEAVTAPTPEPFIVEPPAAELPPLVEPVLPAPSVPSVPAPLFEAPLFGEPAALAEPAPDAPQSERAAWHDEQETANWPAPVVEPETTPVAPLPFGTPAPLAEPATPSRVSARSLLSGEVPQVASPPTGASATGAPATGTPAFGAPAVGTPAGTLDTGWHPELATDQTGTFRRVSAPVFPAPAAAAPQPPAPHQPPAPQPSPGSTPAVTEQSSDSLIPPPPSAFDDIFAGGSNEAADGQWSPEETGKDPKVTRTKQIVARIVLVLLIIGLLIAAYSWVSNGLLNRDDAASPTDNITDFPGPGGDVVEVTIPPGSAGSQMAQLLVEAGIIATRAPFIDAFERGGGAAIQPGTYALPSQIPAVTAVDMLLDNSNQVSHRVTLPEGLTASQIMLRLSEATSIPVDDFMAAATDPVALGIPEAVATNVDLTDHPMGESGAVEGWLFPATYNFNPDLDATAILSEMVAETKRRLAEFDVAEEDFERVLIMASLAEREGRFSEDRQMIIQAINNRLEADWPLQIDAALAYGLNKPGTALTRPGDIQTPNPFNLELNKGLPPTPISSPSEDAINAVLNPIEGPWMFWVTVNLDSGETKFAVTNDEHEVNVAELRAWQAENS